MDSLLPAACEDLSPSPQGTGSISGTAGTEVMSRPFLGLERPAQGAPMMEDSAELAD